ncbi:hypothetical protein BHE74_00001378 [Ensete ventricosum]|nr:hypothetical protein GW17_00013068 [Ensete ventricosum]RWW89633.1 hypothetical protein BHE74_00001378 [Ensete ventricosum]
MMAVGGGGGEEMERDFEAKLRLQQPSTAGDGGHARPVVQRTNSIVFRAPQEQFTINDFELGKIYGVGSYSKVLSLYAQLVPHLYPPSPYCYAPLLLCSYIGYHHEIWHMV